jgi:cytochrome c-type biogenesis protein CcmH
MASLSPEIAMSASLLPFGVMLVVVAAGLLLPIFVLRAGRQVPRAERASAVLRDKLAQVALDRENGLIGREEAIGAEAEISRDLIAAAREIEVGQNATLSDGGGRAGIALVAVLAFGTAIGVYQLKGSIDLPDQPLAARAVQATAAAPSLLSEHDGSVISEAIISLERRLEQDPNNFDQLRLLARSYSAVSAHAQAAETFARLVELAPMDAELRGDYAETLVRAQEGFVGPLAVENFEVVLAHAPGDPRAIYYLALRDAQNGDSLKAAQGWASILRNAPADAPYRPAIREILDAIVKDASLDTALIDIPDRPESAAVVLPGPSAEDVAAAAELPEDEQLQMIRGMVARLESRLEVEPGDIEGWLRLARSRMVLGEPEAGVLALERALAQNPGDPNLQAALIDLREIGN